MVGNGGDPGFSKDAAAGWAVVLVAAGARAGLERSNHKHRRSAFGRGSIFAAYLDCCSRHVGNDDNFRSASPGLSEPGAVACFQRCRGAFLCCPELSARGLIPIVGGARERGTSMLIEDVACPVDKLGDMMIDLIEMFKAHSMESTRVLATLANCTWSGCAANQLLAAVILNVDYFSAANHFLVCRSSFALQNYGYDDASCFGHALEGNLHLVFSQSDIGRASEAVGCHAGAGTAHPLLAGPACCSHLQGFRNKAEVQRFADMMEEMCYIVATKNSGSLKGEHGTGRNMAPFVEMEWGTKVGVCPARQLSGVSRNADEHACMHENTEDHRSCQRATGTASCMFAACDVGLRPPIRPTS
eukprot:1159572-Pelagomonas_calceolata.AAC.5